MRALGTDAVSGGDTWMKFMKLTEEARVRNSGLSTATKRASQTFKTSSSAHTFPGLPLTQPKSTGRVAFVSGAPDVKKRILGGQFDTYA